MDEINRRNAFKLTAAAGMIAAVGGKVVADEKEMVFGEKPTLRDLADKLKVSPAADKSLQRLYEPSDSSFTVLEKLAEGAKAEAKGIELAVKELADGQGSVFAYALSATIPSRGVFGLKLGGQPFVVTRFSCSFDRIAWVAGRGWPLYTSRCPRHDFGAGMFFRDAFAHQLVPWVKGVGYGIGCNNPTAYDFGSAGHLHVGVNDDMYNDNQGTFDFTIYNYS